MTTKMTQLSLRSELLRRQSTTARLLEYLKANGEINTAQLLRHFGTGCSSRLSELRKEGHSIVAQREAPSLYRYVYLGFKEDDGTSLNEVD